jgi:hypothetical protein
MKIELSSYLNILTSKPHIEPCSVGVQIDKYSCSFHTHTRATRMRFEFDPLSRSEANQCLVYYIINTSKAVLPAAPTIFKDIQEYNNIYF